MYDPAIARIKREIEDYDKRISSGVLIAGLPKVKVYVSDLKRLLLRIENLEHQLASKYLEVK